MSAAVWWHGPRTSLLDPLAARSSRPSSRSSPDDATMAPTWVSAQVGLERLPRRFRGGGFSASRLRGDPSFRLRNEEADQRLRTAGQCAPAGPAHSASLSGLGIILSSAAAKKPNAKAILHVLHGPRPVLLRPLSATQRSAGGPFRLRCRSLRIALQVAFEPSLASPLSPVTRRRSRCDHHGCGPADSGRDHPDSGLPPMPLA